MPAPRLAAEAEEIHAALAAHSVASRRLQPQDPQLSGRTDPMILNAAFLLPDGDTASFDAAVRALSEQHRATEIQVQGPWPPTPSRCSHDRRERPQPRDPVLPAGLAVRRRPGRDPAQCPDHLGPGGDDGEGGSLTMSGEQQARLTHRLETDPESVQRDLCKLVLTVVELVRQLMEAQALRRVDEGDLTDEQVEGLGLGLMRLEEAMEQGAHQLRARLVVLDACHQPLLRRSGVSREQSPEWSVVALQDKIRKETYPSIPMIKRLRALLV